MWDGLADPGRQSEHWLPALGDKGPAPDPHRRPCVPVLPVLPEPPAPGPMGFRQPRRWSSHQGLSGTWLFAAEWAVAASVPCLMKALCHLSRPSQIFSPPMQCSWIHQCVWQRRFLCFLFPISSRMVPVPWESSQPQRAGSSFGCSVQPWRAILRRFGSW